MRGWPRCCRLKRRRPFPTVGRYGSKLPDGALPGIRGAGCNRSGSFADRLNGADSHSSREPGRRNGPQQCRSQHRITPELSRATKWLRLERIVMRGWPRCWRHEAKDGRTPRLADTVPSCGMGLYREPVARGVTEDEGITRTLPGAGSQRSRVLAKGVARSFNNPSTV